MIISCKDMQIPQDGNYKDVTGENVFVLQIMTCTAIKAREKNCARVSPPPTSLSSAKITLNTFHIVSVIQSPCTAQRSAAQYNKSSLWQIGVNHFLTLLQKPLKSIQCQSQRQHEDRLCYRREAVDTSTSNIEFQVLTFEYHDLVDFLWKSTTTIGMHRPQNLTGIVYFSWLRRRNRKLRAEK